MSSYNIKNKNDIISISGLSFIDKTAVEHSDVTNKNEFILAEDVNEIKRAVNDTLSGISLFSITISDDLSSLQSESITLNQSINDLSEQIFNIQLINNIKLSQLNTAIIQNSGNITNLSLSTEQLKNDLISTQSTYAKKTAVTYLQSEIDILSTQHERTNLSLSAVDDLLSGKLTEISGKVDAIQPYDDDAIFGRLTKLENLSSEFKDADNDLSSNIISTNEKLIELSGKVDDVSIPFDDTTINNRLDSLEQSSENLSSKQSILSSAINEVDAKVNAIRPYDDTGIKESLRIVNGKVDAIQPYDDSQLVNDISFISGKISPLELKTLKNEMNIVELSGKVQNLHNYDDTQIRNKVNANETNIFNLSSQVQAIQESGYDDSTLVERISNVENVQTQVRTDIINANNRITINYLELTGKLSSLADRFNDYLNVQPEINDKISYLSSAIDAVSEQGYNDTELRGRIESLEQIHSEDFSQFVTAVNELSGKLKNL